MEQFSSFVQEVLEFLSLIRASEKERFEAEKKFMAETTGVLKGLAASVQSNNELIKTSLENLALAVDSKLKDVEEKIGIDKLTQAINALEIAVDLLQRGSTLLDYKFTVQKTRDMLDEIKRNISNVKFVNSSTSTPSQSTHIPVPVTPPPVNPSPIASAPIEPPIKKPPAEPIVIKSPSPSPKNEPVAPSTVNHIDESPSRQTSSIDAMMGTRTQQPRRAVSLKKPPKTKIISSKGEAIEIELDSDDEG
ncbi:MAG: hypothetical protein EU536_02385 [Promethearchaeota archaeon]|nr:MAG: hypothetical protein EU536_02385 [Candidatus Lokiarchaeota archaeon]